MPYRAVKHDFSGLTTSIAAYDPTKTNLGSLMIQNTGSTYLDKYVGPLQSGYTNPIQQVVHTGNVSSVSSTQVNGSSTSFTASMNGMLIGFGSIDPAKVTAWYTLGAWTSATVIAVTSGPTISTTTPFVIVCNIPVMYPHVITYSPTIDLVFLTENLATASTPRRIVLYEFNKTTAVYTWKGFINATLISSSNANTTRGFRAFRYLHTAGTASVSTATVTGVGTAWQTERLAIGARIGFGSIDPTQITTWYYINAVNSDTSLTIQTNTTANGTGGTAANVSIASGAYVIEEFRFALAVTQITAPSNGGLFLVKGISYDDFVPTGTIIAVGSSTDNVKALYGLWNADSGKATPYAACGCSIVPETNKGLHYAYVLDGFGSTLMKVYRYNLRATGTTLSGRIILSNLYYTTGTVAVTGGAVSGTGTTFTQAMVGMKIGFGSTSPALITTWYIIGSYASGTSITLTNLSVTVSGGSAYIIDSADIATTGNEGVSGTVAGINNGRIGTLNHGPGAGQQSLYFVTSTRIYRAPISKIYSGALDWIADDRPEIPTGGTNSFPATGALSCVEIADSIDRLVVMSTGASGTRHYVTSYSDRAGDNFDHIWGVDDKQQDNAAHVSGAYITSGTVAVSGVTITGTGTFFTAAMVGFRIGFGTTNPSSVTTWYTINMFTSATSMSVTVATPGYSGGTAYVIDLNSNVFPHFNTASQLCSIWGENGVLHVVKQATTAALCQMYSMPFGAHWTYAASNNQRVITPALCTTDCADFYRVAVSSLNRFGGGEFSVPAEPYRLYYRTNGIAANTGAWALVPKNGDLTSVVGAPNIQFMFEFCTIGWFCVPARIFSLAVFYDDGGMATDSHFQPSLDKSDAASKRFAWRFATPFGGTVPPLRVRFYNAATGVLLLDKYTTSTDGGTWEKMTDGTNWVPYGTLADKGTETTYIRYTPSTFYDNITVRAVLTQ